MAPFALLPPVLPVQELWDHIIDQVDRFWDLKSCALVSRSLTRRSQHHFYREVTFGREDADEELAACLHLVGILAASPHLKSHIRRICLPFSAEILAHVCAMRLPRLQEIEFLQEGDCPSADDPCFGLAHDLIALPSVRSVRIDVQKWSFEDGAGVAPRALARLFQNSVPHLEHLAFTLGNSGARGESVVPQPVCEKRAQIKSLKVMFSPEVGDYLTHPGCPFDLSRLEDVQMSCSMTPALEQALEYGRLTIRRLECSADDLAWGLGLQRFPYLTQLTIVAYGSELPDVISGLSTASGNGFKSIVLVIPVDAVPNWAKKESIECLDDLLASSAMPALRKVEIRFNADSTPKKRLATQNILLSSFPKLHAKRLLQVPN